MNRKRKNASEKNVTDSDTGHANVDSYVRVHLCFGWWALLVFLSGGIALESIHGLKLGFYLDVGNEVRRLMWTLAHAHGTLLALVNLAFAASMNILWTSGTRGLRIGSSCLISASIALPGGFFLGGVTIYGGDPGVGILLVPVGAFCLLVSVLTTALKATRALRSR